MVSRRENKPERKITLILLPNAIGKKSLQLSFSLHSVLIISAVIATILGFIAFSGYRMGKVKKAAQSNVRPIRITTSVALRSLPSVALSSTLILLI